MSLRDYLRAIDPSRKGARNLTFEEAREAFSAILSGTESDISSASFLVAMRYKGVTVEELRGFATAARNRAHIPCQDVSGLVCICSPHDGTAGVPPLDVASGLIAAGAGARVLILSDKAVPPRRGLTAANVLDQLGAQMTWDPDEAESWVAKTRFAACSVSGMLPALMQLRKVRDEVGVRTPLSTIEKLIAPASAAVVIGAQGGPVLGIAVEVMQGLGHPHAITLQGIEGGVTPYISRRTRGVELDRSHLVTLHVEPKDFGLDDTREPELPLFCPPPDGQGPGDTPGLVKAAGDLNALALAGEPGRERKAAVLGAALILKAAGRSMTLAEGVDAATRSLDSGEASAVLTRYKELSNS